MPQQTVYDYKYEILNLDNGKTFPVFKTFFESRRFEQKVKYSKKLIIVAKIKLY